MLRTTFGAGFRSHAETNQEDTELMEFEFSHGADSAALFVPQQFQLDKLFRDPEKERHAKAHIDDNPKTKTGPIPENRIAATTRLFLGIPHILAQCCRAAGNILAVYAVTDIADNRDLQAHSIEAVVDAASADIVESMGTDFLELEESRVVALVLLFGAVFLHMVSKQNVFLTNAVLDLFAHLKASGLDLARFSVPRFGEPAECVAFRARQMLAHYLGTDILDLLADSPTVDRCMDELERQSLLQCEFEGGAAARAALHARLPRISQDALIGLVRRPQYFSLFFASPSRAPLAWPPRQDRIHVEAELLGSQLDYAAARRHVVAKGNSESTYTEAGQTAVRGIADKPSDLRTAHLPLCALSAFKHATETSVGGDGGVWHNKDRMLMANYIMDVGQFDIEDMDRFFTERLSIGSKNAHNFGDRKHHAMTHVRRYASQAQGREQRGYMPILTSNCTRMGDADFIDDKQTFRCPYTQTDPTRIEELLGFQNLVQDDAKKKIVTLALRGDTTGACLAHYNATQPKDAFQRHKNITNPVFYTYAKALSARYHSE